MELAELPAEGRLQLGKVALPPGRQVRGFGGSAVAWVTRRAVPDAGRVWAALSAAHPGTGLVPFLAVSLPSDNRRPWDTGEFWATADPALLDGMDAAAVLADMWDGEMPSDEEEAEDSWPAQMRAPFSRQFPGLAPPGDTPLTLAEADTVLGALGAARIGLVPAARSADVLPLLGWTPSDQSDALPIAAVMRSWEDRFGARLLRVGFAEISVLAARPPRETRHAQNLAAEQMVFCDECAGQGLSDVPSITGALLASPIWTFWWD
jgi:hypothetical protein